MKIRVTSVFYDKYHRSTRFEVGAILDFDDERANDIISKGLGEPYSEPEKKAEQLELGLKVEAPKTEVLEAEAEPKKEDDVEAEDNAEAVAEEQTDAKAEDKAEAVAEEPKEEVKVVKAEKSKTEGKAQKKAEK